MRDEVTDARRRAEKLTHDRPDHPNRPGGLTQRLRLDHHHALSSHLTLTAALEKGLDRRPYPLLPVGRRHTAALVSALTYTVPLPTLPRRPALTVTLAHTHQNSNHPLFDLTRTDLTVALTWAW